MGSAARLLLSEQNVEVEVQGLHGENEAEFTKGLLGTARIRPDLNHCKELSSRPPVSPGQGWVVEPGPGHKNQAGDPCSHQ